MKMIRWEDLRAEWIRKGKITEEGLALESVKLMLAELLYKLRKQRKVSQKRLAVIVGVSQPFIAKIESGEANLTLETIVKILSALHMSLYIRPQKRRKNEDILQIAKAA